MSNIRKLMVMRHDMPVLEMQRQLEDNNIRLDWHYIAKLREKVIRERISRMDRKILDYALSGFEDSMLEIVVQLWQIATSAKSKTGEKIYALAELRKTYDLAFDKLFDAGIFKRHLGRLDVRLRNALLPDEAREEVMRTAKSWFGRRQLYAGDNDKTQQIDEPADPRGSSDNAAQVAGASRVA